jgi:isoamylase
VIKWLWLRAGPPRRNRKRIVGHGVTMGSVSAGRARSLAETPVASTKQSLGLGSSSPLGATVIASGVNFSIYSRSATGVELLLFDRDDDAHAARAITLDASANHTFNYWHVFVPGLKPGQLYAYRVQGPFDPALGKRFDPAKVLLDPYGLGVVVREMFLV